MNNDAGLFGLGYSYEKGYGVEIDLKLAKTYYGASAALGYEQSINRLKELEAPDYKSNYILPMQYAGVIGNTYESIPIENKSLIELCNGSGHLIFYDWNGGKVNKIVPIQILNKGNNVYTYIIDGIVNQFKANFDGNTISFDGFKIDDKSCLNSRISWNVDQGYFNIENNDDKTYVIGDLKLFSNELLEPGTKTVLVLNRKNDSPEKEFSIVNENSIKVFPNPFMQNMTIEIEMADKEIGTMYITDFNGRIIKNVFEDVLLEKGSYMYNLDCLVDPGNYLLILKTPSQVQTIKIIKIQ